MIVYQWIKVSNQNKTQIQKLVTYLTTSQSKTKAEFNNNTVITNNYTCAFKIRHE